jgi:hypothetical protein
MKEIKNERMSVERWKQACNAGCCQSNYRRERGMTETNDDYFVDGVQWADEHPKKSWWRPVTEWPKDGEKILMKLSNGKYQYSEWEDDGKGFNEGFAELNFGGGAMMRLPITYQVEAWRPLADVINELSDHGVICTQESNDPKMKAKLVDFDLSVRTLNILHAGGIDTIGELVKLYKTDVLKLRNAGRKTLTELDDFLTAHNLTWGMNV